MVNITLSQENLSGKTSKKIKNGIHSVIMLSSNSFTSDPITILNSK
jgi:hypothetical protein